LWFTFYTTMEYGLSRYGISMALHGIIFLTTTPKA
jgi:hypothetical protein